MINSKSLVAAAALAASVLYAAPPAISDALAGKHELVVLAEPAAPAVAPQPGPMDLTLTWTVREIFAGEPDSVTIAVRHPQLTPAQFEALAGGGRWIVLADKDAKRPGRWVAPMPLRATEAATDAFRKWSAPPDVRPARELGSVVAEVKDAPVVAPERIAPPVPARQPEPAPEIVEETAPPSEPEPAPEPLVAEGPVMEPVVAATPEEPEAPVDRDAAVPPPASEVIADSRVLVAEPERVEPPAAEPVNRFESVNRLEAITEPAAPVRIAEVDIPESWPATPAQPRPETRGPLAAPPLTYEPTLAPPGGPGLPPPPPARPLGPPPSRRDDLKKAKPPAEDDDEA